MVLVCDLVKESVTVNRQLIDDLVDNRLNLKLRENATSNALIEKFAADAAQLHRGDPANVAIIEELGDDADVL